MTIEETLATSDSSKQKLVIWKLCLSKASVGIIFFTLAALIMAPISPRGLLSAAEQRGPQTAVAAGMAPTISATDRSRIVKAYGNLPLSFEANRGQSSDGVKFLSRGAGYGLFLTSNEAVFAFRSAGPKPTKASATTLGNRSAAATLTWVGASPRSELAGVEELPGKSNYFAGNKPSAWLTEIPNYRKVIEHGVYPGIDLVYYGSQRQLEYDLIVAPGVDPRVIKLRLKGAREVRTDLSGDLVVSVAGGELRLRKPAAYQEVDGATRTVKAGYTLERNREIGFRVANYDRSRPLIIDPILLYSTYLGGSNIDGANAIAVAPDRTAFIAGGTFSADIPTAHPLQPNAGGPNDFPQDAFVAKISADGSTLLYSTYLGGKNQDVANGIAVDTFGNAYVTGTTISPDFPVTPGDFDPECGGDGECGASLNRNGLLVFNAFATKINAAGSALVYSGFIGTDQNDLGFAIAVDNDGNAYVTGQTDGGPGCTAASVYCFPTTSNAVQTAFGGLTDGFLFKISATGSSVAYSTYFGGSNQDDGFALAVDNTGNAYVTGLTYSTDFPVSSTKFQGAYAGAGDTFLTKINTNAGGATGLVYSTYLGGGGFDQGNGVAVDSGRNAYVTGVTRSSNFPVTAGVFQTKCDGSICPGHARATPL